MVLLQQPLPASPVLRTWGWLDLLSGIPLPIFSRQKDDKEVIIATLQQDLNTLMADVATIKQLLQQRDQTS